MMKLETLKFLEDRAFEEMRRRYPRMDTGDLQSVVIAFKILNEFVEKEQGEPIQ